MAREKMIQERLRVTEEGGSGEDLKKRISKEINMFK